MLGAHGDLVPRERTPPPRANARHREEGRRWGLAPPASFRPKAAHRVNRDLSVWAEAVAFSRCRRGSDKLGDQRRHRRKFVYKSMGCGGGSGIRTRDTVSRIHTFQACAFNHSATRPGPAQPTPSIRNRRERRGGPPRQLRSFDSRRTGRDSNSRYEVHPYAGFRDRCLQPLGHLSGTAVKIRS